LELPEQVYEKEAKVEVTREGLMFELPQDSIEAVPKTGRTDEYLNDTFEK
jgi:hypothetical protein